MFLSDATGKFCRSYTELVDDLIANAVVVDDQCETSTLYGLVVYWLGQILRGETEVRFPILSNNGTSGVPTSDRTFHHASSLPPRICAALRQNVPQHIPQKVEGEANDNASQLDDWRRLFLDSSSRILLETSGSTGKPKEIWHSVATISRGLNLAPMQRHSIWGLAYPVDHLGGIQVLFQGLFNGNHLVNLYRASLSEVHQALDLWKVTHLSCTPTFLRLILGDPSVHPALIRLTNGGERYDVALDGGIRRMFPNARRRNIYASTEVGPLFFSETDVFEVPESMLDSVLIVDGELWLHDQLKVDYQLDSESTLLDRGTIHSGFWPTGDQVEILSENPLRIRFLSRSSEGFNVAGFRVDPVRLETIAREHPNVAQARIYGIPNSVTENLVGCDLVAAPEKGLIETSEWQAWFRQKVERHEVPRIVRWVDRIATTKSGKVKRV